MKNKSKKMMMFSLFIMCGISIISLIVAFFIRDIPENISYVYVNKIIERHSWHDIYEIINIIFFCLEFGVTIASTIFFIIAKVQTKEKTLKKTVSLWFAFVISTIMLLFSNVVVIGLYDENDYSPECFEFSDNKHTLVIEEKSFLLDGRGNVFQIQDDSSAILLKSFSTDDGGRNLGVYDIVWFNNYAEITYHTFINENDKETIVVNFK